MPCDSLITYIEFYQMSEHKNHVFENSHTVTLLSSILLFCSYCCVADLYKRCNVIQCYFSTLISARNLMSEVVSSRKSNRFS